MSEHVDTWIAMRARLAARKNWVQHDWARNASGHNCRPRDGDAVAWCMGGAALCVASSLATTDAMRALATITGTDLQGFPASFNDTHEHEEVLALLDKGIALGRASRTLPSLLDIPASPTRVNETV